jgi:hypothetical protein
MQMDEIEKSFSDCAARIGDAQVRSGLTTMFNNLKNKHKLAGDPADRLAIEERLLQLVNVAQITASSGGTAWRIFSMAALAIAGLLFMGGVIAFFVALGPDRYSSIGNTRPVLVITLIVSMLGFGGLLIIRPLFSAESGEELNNRFRLSREVFLVFSGIFGTVIGFYFGAGEEDGGDRTPSVSVEWANGTVTASMENGTGPFVGLLRAKGEADQLMKTEGLVLTIASETCPDEASIVVFDSAGHRVEEKVVCGDSGEEAPLENVAGSESAGSATDPNTSGNISTAEEPGNGL